METKTVKTVYKRLYTEMVGALHLADLSDDDWTEVELLMPPVAAS
jgi:hypothetical protein